MPRVDVVNQCVVRKTSRLVQLQGFFDVAIPDVSTEHYEVDFPFEDHPWNVGLIVGPSGSGKTSIAKSVFGQLAMRNPQWPADESIVDGFPDSLSIKEITGALSAVGFSSPPNWMRPFHVLSTGEKFRANIARKLVEDPIGKFEGGVVDEFTSVVDRTVAQIGSAAVAKAVRRMNKKFVAVGCHYDVIEWLQPDWVLDTGAMTFTRRRLRRRPDVRLEITREDWRSWQTFSRYHYLSDSISKAAHCYVAKVEGRACAFGAVVYFPHPARSGYRGHRTVCLPDFQGIGIGNSVSEYLASLYAATGKPFRSVTSHPAMIAHRNASPLWKMIRAPAIRRGSHKGSMAKKGMNLTIARTRLTATFEYIGPANHADAVAFGVIKSEVTS